MNARSLSMKNTCQAYRLALDLDAGVARFRASLYCGKVSSEGPRLAA
jgi:hypothetical protein